MGVETLDALESSAGRHWQSLNFRSLTEMNYPQYDICNEILDQQFDIILADNVLKHLKRPREAAENIRKMLKPGGYFVNLTLLLIRYHPIPFDGTRWTESSMRYVLIDAGFDSVLIQIF